MSTYSLKTKKKFEITARSIAIVFGIIFLSLFFWNLLNYQDPKPSEDGIFFIFKNEDAVQQESSASLVMEEDEEVVKTTRPKAKTNKVVIKKDVVIDHESKAIPIQKEKQNEENPSEDNANEMAQEEEANELKDGIKNALETSKEKTNTTGEDEEGPNLDRLNEVTAGLGVLGGGLDSRGGSGPNISDKSQATGVVVVKVCIDESGNVVSSKFTQNGSTATDSQLRKLAEENARKWKFKKGSIDKQCGTITYDFKVK